MVYDHNVTQASLFTESGVNTLVKKTIEVGKNRPI